MTPERINWLLASLDKAKLEHEELYREILIRWNNGDFSRVDKDHNAIWDLENGSIGRATGLLTPEEEAPYIESSEEGPTYTPQQMEEEDNE
ncbi:MAG TPA: DUF6241 domain-containing protein [Bacillaceae bacterium]|nr:DUF6241 domain-containing protein [Bacillaceae bacterium]